ncbi:hypothetical protein THTE_4185 [Thermogutta terrifontis]|uniref:Peptide chain release factor 3 n=1 Tax=Thermogutta terrifontis TaxID=1331910 RepID=A0A286RLE8_9BACT|nr:VLRF1 family aeRF1-type release factor [Thermogutta terrifontis]ASV76786.1 hypothetical protein THTE_4185 [Thermogutta terrifontis]
MITQEDIERLRKGIGEHAEPVLSLYCDVNPAKPENAGRAWIKRCKNSLSEIPDLRVPKKRAKTLYDEILTLLDLSVPEAKTMALFAAEDEHGKLTTERFDLQVELPVVDLAHGRVEVRWGKPYITPLVFAFDEYERAGVLHLRRSQWRFYEIFLGEVREDTQIFAEITPNQWKELADYRKVLEGGLLRAKSVRDQDKYRAKLQTWARNFYSKLARLLEQCILRLDVNRLVLMGDDWETGFFEVFLNRNLRGRLVGRVGHPPVIDEASSKDILEKVEPLLNEAERRDEMRLLTEIREGAGIWGAEKTLEALQMGRIQVLVLPWNLDLKVWRCPHEGFLAETKETALTFCEQPVEIPLRDYVFDIAEDYGSRLEFVRGEPERVLKEEMGGMAGKTRW